MYYQPVELIQQGIRIFRCYRCQTFGHVSSNCHSKVSCKHCSGEHSVDNCKGNQPARCTSCSRSHETDSLDCPTYFKQVQNVYTREVYGHRIGETLCQKMMAIHGFTFLQIKVCGLSDHSKIALNQNLQQTKADIVFLDETKTHISANLFDNFTTFICMGGSSGSVAILLKNHIPYSILNQVEDSSIDNVVFPVRLGGIKLVVSTAYVRPDDFEGLRKTIKVRQSCKTYVDKRCPNGTLFFGDLNARHTYWGDNLCTLLGEELVQLTDHFSFLNDGESTFLAANGFSVINLCIFMSLCSIDVNTLCLRMKLLSCSPVLH